MLTAQATLWEVPPTNLYIADEAVHIWRAPLNLLEVVLQNLWHVLGEAECAQAQRFHFDVDRQRYVAAHGILRTILSRYVGVLPEQLRFQRGLHGKPSLIGAPVHFNLSHADDLLVCAVARNRRVGVDVERLRTNFECEPVAEHIFSARELAAWSALPTAQKPKAFFKCWVRKEAYVKALGAGFSWPVSHCEALLMPDRHFDGSWSWQPLAPGPDYVGALVAEGENQQLTCWEWPEKAGFAVNERKSPVNHVAFVYP